MRWVGLVRNVMLGRDGLDRALLIDTSARAGFQMSAPTSPPAVLVSQRSHRLRMFDPECVGYMLRENLSDFPVRDFRDWESRRILTPIVADEMVRLTGQSLIAPQTVLEETYWDELLLGLTTRGHDVFHVLLEADETTMRNRIEADRELAVARQGRLDHLQTFTEARPWRVAPIGSWKRRDSRRSMSPTASGRPHGAGTDGGKAGVSG